MVLCLYFVADTKTIPAVTLIAELVFTLGNSFNNLHHGLSKMLRDVDKRINDEKLEAFKLRVCFMLLER